LCLSGAGNDFVVIDNRDSIIPHEVTNFLRKICQRRVSIGADGVLLVEESDLADSKCVTSTLMVRKLKLAAMALDVYHYLLI
jgi:diaminopimelate epimerase